LLTGPIDVENPDRSCDNALFCKTILTFSYSTADYEYCFAELLDKTD